MRGPLCLVFAVVFVVPSPSALAGDGPTNFVVIMADDLGADELGCYGHAKHATPNLDRLAAEGMRFTTCWATPLGTPTRMLLMTGQYGHRNGYFQLLGRPLTPRLTSPLYDLADKVTFATLLDRQGYQTAIAGKWQLPGKLPNLVRECGFDRYRVWAYRHNLPPGVKHLGGWEDERERVTSRYWHPCILEDGNLLATERKDYGPDLYCRFLEDFIRAHHSERFLVYYPMCLTHRPWAPTPDPRQADRRGEGGLARNVAYMDELVGRLMAVLDELGLREETLILFTTDNGTQGGGKAKLVEKGVRVPLIASCPGTIPLKTTSDALVSLADVLPTLAAWAGASLPDGREIDGKSLVPVLTGEGETHREFLYSYLGEGEMARDERWLVDGRGRYFDTWEFARKGYRDVTEDERPEAVAARRRLDAFLEAIPGPEALAGELIQPADRGGRGARRR